MVKPVETGHVVMEFKIGNSTIKICDDKCNDEIKINQAKKGVERVGRQILLAALEAGKFG